jgi:hypothetical protein
LKAWAPPVLSTSMLQVDDGRALGYRSPRLAFSITSALEKVDASGLLVMDFGFYPDGGSIVWDVAGVVLHEDSDSKTEAGAFRYRAPDEDSPDGYRKNWEKRLRAEHPFDAIADVEKDRLYIRANVAPPKSSPPPDVMYTFVYRSDPVTPQAVMKQKLDLLMKSVHVLEH